MTGFRTEQPIAPEKPDASVVMNDDLLDQLSIRPQVRLLFFADSHGREDWMIRLARQHPEVDLILHLGDHCASLPALASQMSQPMLAVHGNCDGWIGRDLPGQLLLKLAGHRLFMTHGHLYGVKHRLGSILAAGASAPNSADIILFGHTHQFLEKEVEFAGHPILLLNPGSARGGSSGHPASAALLYLATDQIICEGLLDQN